MAWIALATTLLLWSAFTGGSRHIDWLLVTSAACVLALAVYAVRVYPPHAEAISLLGGIVAAMIALWVTGSRGSWARAAALCVGAAAGLFSVFGPAQGLFP